MRLSFCQVADNCKGYSPPPVQHNRYVTHGVSGAAMPLKEGAVRWRMTRLPQHWNLSYLKLDTLDRYHGQPTGMYVVTSDPAPETLVPSRFVV